jgi:hypothetical protein
LALQNSLCGWCASRRLCVDRTNPPRAYSGSFEAPEDARTCPERLVLPPRGPDCKGYVRGFTETGGTEESSEDRCSVVLPEEEPVRARTHTHTHARRAMISRCRSPIVGVRRSSWTRLKISGPCTSTGARSRVGAPRPGRSCRCLCAPRIRDFFRPFYEQCAARLDARRPAQYAAITAPRRAVRVGAIASKRGHVVVLHHYEPRSPAYMFFGLISRHCHRSVTELAAKRVCFCDDVRVPSRLRPAVPKRRRVLCRRLIGPP